MKVFSLFATVLFLSNNGFAAAPVDGPNFQCKDGSTVDLLREDEFHATAKVTFKKSGKSDVVMLISRTSAATNGKIVATDVGQVGDFKAASEDKITLVFFDIATLECEKVK